jgi:hypothetical protein
MIIIIITVHSKWLAVQIRAMAGVTHCIILLARLRYQLTAQL